MTKPFSFISMSLTAAVAAGTVVAAQQPRVANGRVTAQSAPSPFVQSFRTLVSSQPEVGWIGYSVPVVDSERVMCCFDSGTTWMNGDIVMSDSQRCCGSCRLEPGGEGASMSTSAGETVRLEGSDRMFVLFRVAEKKVDRVRVFSEECHLDAGGKTVVWLQDVRPADSVALLESLIVPDAARRDRVSDGAISAIALTRDPSADASLDRLVVPTQPEPVRKKVSFWLGNARGRHGMDVLKRMLREDPSIEVRKSAVFAVSQSREADVFDTLSGIAKGDAEPRLRSEALFWLAQKGDARASKVILDALEKDASPEVRKKAVFALSQLKDDAGVDALLQVARTHAESGTRAEAIFWLGQKAGRKASAAITERIDQDPDTDVKKKAVFALSQLPKDEGIPLLINVAKTNTNPAVRKQAIFWLGQSKDPRALDFFAEILAK
jgi:HEAT repeat protein